MYKVSPNVFMYSYSHSKLSKSSLMIQWQGSYLCILWRLELSIYFDPKNSFIPLSLLLFKSLVQLRFLKK